MTWRCHVCGDERPDAAISTYVRHYRLPGGVPMATSIRFCNDRSACAEGAYAPDPFAPVDAQEVVR